MYRSKQRPKGVTKRAPQSRRKKSPVKPAQRDVRTRFTGLYQGAVRRVYGADGDRADRMTPEDLSQVLGEAINKFLKDNHDSKDRAAVAAILIEFAKLREPRTT